jgi:hypothetical protein
MDRGVFEENAMTIRKMAAVLVAAIFAVALGASGAAAQGHTSKPFAGAKVNGGTVTHTIENGKHVLTLSDDFKVPDTPDPHWQIVDAKGRIYLLQRLKAKGTLAGLAGDRINMSITLPSYIQDVAKVQIYCAWAEAILGETTFDSTVTTVAAK